MLKIKISHEFKKFKYKAKYVKRKKIQQKGNLLN